MSVRTLAPTREPFPVTVAGLRFDAVAPDLWRVSRVSGAVLGHVERHRRSGDERFSARRMAPGAVAPRVIGDFWSARDAAECFR